MNIFKNSNSTVKMAQLKKAEKKVQEAIASLHEAAGNSENFAEMETIRAFQLQLSAFLSSDHGQAGLSAFIINE